MWLVTALNQSQAYSPPPPPPPWFTVGPPPVSRRPLSCHHLSTSHLGWHTSTAAMTLLGEDQVFLSLLLALWPSVPEEFLPLKLFVIDIPVFVFLLNSLYCPLVHCLVLLTRPLWTKCQRLFLRKSFFGLDNDSCCPPFWIFDVTGHECIYRHLHTSPMI